MTLRQFYFRGLLQFLKERCILNSGLPIPLTGGDQVALVTQKVLNLPYSGLHLRSALARVSLLCHGGYQFPVLALAIGGTLALVPQSRHDADRSEASEQGVERAEFVAELPRLFERVTVVEEGVKAPKRHHCKTAHYEDAKTGNVFHGCMFLPANGIGCNAGGVA